MNILLCAYACEPHKGSEPEVGWRMVNEISKIMQNDVIYVITKHNNKESIEKENYPINIKFYYYAPPRWLTFWKKGGRGVRTYYYIWMLTAALFIKNKKIKFDIIHHVTFVNDWLPSLFYLLKMKQNKFIWGPIGSHAPIDIKFLDGIKRKIIEKIRIFLQLFFRNIDPCFYICKAKSDCIIGITDIVKTNLNLDENKYFLSEPAIAVKESIVLNISRVNTSKNIFTIVSVGRLLYIKNFKLTILAFSNFLKINSENINACLQIIGEGEDKNSLISFAEKLNIIDRIEFLGQMKRDKVQEHFSKADLFLFPTLESAGFVTLEAMSYALPVVAMDYGGPKQFIKHHKIEQLADSSGSYEKIAKDLAYKIKYFSDNKQFSEVVGRQNKRDVLEHFTWEAKAKKIKNLYSELLNEK